MNIISNILIMLISLIFVIFFTRITYAECDWSSIKTTTNGYLYTEECHLKVGKNVKDLEYKDLIIEKQEQRIELWRNTTYKLEEQVSSFDKWKEANKYVYFGLGVLFTGGTIWLAGQVYR